MSTNTINGRPQRKQLSDQLDRLDSVINCLAEGLSKAVADAAPEGSRAAVREILTELLTNPDILGMIRAAVGTMLPAPTLPTPEEPAPAAPAAKPRGLLATAATSVTRRVNSAVYIVTNKVRSTWNTFTSTVAAVRQVPQFKKVLLVGTGVGLAAAVVATTNHSVAAALSGLGAAATAVAVQVGGWLRGARRRLGLA